MHVYVSHRKYLCIPDTCKQCVYMYIESPQLSHIPSSGVGSQVGQAGQVGQVGQEPSVGHVGQVEQPSQRRDESINAPGHTTSISNCCHVHVQCSGLEG